ncbi:MAG: rhaB, partial [Bryobacterales bacterium]|nr:rhaB [Bryobacterales bacterium]
RSMNFTNVGGVCGTTRLLKNVMGLWMLQGCKKRWAALGSEFEYGELIRMAMSEPGFRHLVDPDDPRFLRPDCMLTAIDSFCRDTNQPTPKSPGAYVRTVLESLALKYRIVLRDLERLTGVKLDSLRKIGGGSKNELLNQFAADATGKRVLAGPVEATALGNIAMQMLATGATASLQESRVVVDRSYQTIVYEPGDTVCWDERVEIFEQYCEMKYV